MLSDIQLWICNTNNISTLRGTPKRLPTRGRHLIQAISSIAVAFACSSTPSPVAVEDPVSSDPPPPATTVNEAPIFTAPVTLTDHNRSYRYAISVSDPDGDPVTVTVDSKPAWMDYNSDSLLLSGIAGWDNLGFHGVVITASDSDETVHQNFNVNVVIGEIVCNQDFGDPAQSLFVMPYAPGKTQFMIQSYCPPNPTWGHTNWFAYDFDTDIGDTIIATRAGTVLFTQEGFTDGNRTPGNENFVFIQHADGTIMHYMHLTQNGALVEVGDVVTQGQPIALSGDSGGSSGPHIHIALFRERVFDRQYTVPINFRNAEGPIDANRGLMLQQNYTAGAFTPDSR